MRHICHSPTNSNTRMTASTPHLQFDTADGIAPGQVICSRCEKSLDREYHQLNAQAVCGECRVRADVEHARDQRPSQFLIAAGYGFGAAIVGGVLYWGFVKVTDIELGLMAIAVGWLVGKAVMKGSNARGGRRYQVLAVVLTYLSIAMSYGALAFGQILAESSSSSSKSSVTAKNSTDKITTPASSADSSGSAPRSTVAGTGETSAPGAPAPAATPSATDRAPDADERSARQLLLSIGALLLLVLVSPFLAGLSNIIGWLIIAIGLYEAWKHTRAVPHASSGPFSIAQPSPPAPHVPLIQNAGVEPDDTPA
jgi:hypothetical protein